MSEFASEYHLISDSLAQWVEAAPAAPPDWSEDTWGRFKEGCLAHGVASLLYPRRGEMGGWPDGILAWIEHQYAQNRRRVSRLTDELAAILGAFARSGIRVMPMKGLYVVELAYRDIGLRPMNDLDLLLAPEDFEAGEELLAELGYEKTFGGWKHTVFSKPEAREIVDWGCEHPDNPRPLEVHPGCVEKIGDFRIDLTEQVWASAGPGRLVGQETWLMSRDALWAHLLIHATHHMLHNNFRLIQLLDLVRLRSAAPIPEQVLTSFDARGSIAPLVLMQRYFPSPEGEALVRDQRERVKPSFAAWADSLDLFTVSYLNPTPWRA